VGDRRGASGVLVLNVREEDNLEDLSVGARVILKRIFFYCYTVHVVELLNYYTNYCTYIKFIKFTY